MNLYGPPSCTFGAFAAHLAAVHDPQTGNASPAAPEARAIWAVFVGRLIDPAVALGFFHHESACGTRGRALATRSWGNLRWRTEYAALAYPVAMVGGFASYPSYTVAALHFADHLTGRDGTDFYRGLTTVELVVPKWAPAADGNDPAAYISAVESFAGSLRGNMPKVLVVAGHLRCANITTAGLCPAIANDASVAKLRASTGSAGEAAYVGDFATRLADALRAAGVDARPLDCTYDVETYETWKPDGVLALHCHRDAPRERAMFAKPEPGLGFQDANASAESSRLEARIEAAYEARTGIPLSEDLVTLNMTQLYTWCFIPSTAWALCCELGNANVDAPALYNGIAAIVTYLRDCVLEHLNLAIPGAPPARRAGDTPPPAPVVTKETVAAALEGIARQVRELP